MAAREAGAAQPRVPRGHVSHNWLPVAGIGSLFVGGAVAALVFDGDTGRTAVYFVVGTLVLILLTAPWLVRHPPAMRAGGRGTSPSMASTCTDLPEPLSPWRRSADSVRGWCSGSASRCTGTWSGAA